MANDPPVVPEYAHQLLERVIEATQAPILLSAEDQLAFDSEVCMARSDRPVHVIRIRQEYQQHAIHFLVNGAAKILRFYEAPPTERLIATSIRGDRLPVEIENDMVKRLPPLPANVIRTASAVLRQGLIRQVTSYPHDLRTEQSIHHLLPEHREAQQKYLRQQVHDLAVLFDPTFHDMMPARVYRATAAMNVAFVEELSDMVGMEPPAAARRSPHRALGQRLRRHFRGVADGYCGDRLVSDAWAHELDMRSWYTWSLYNQTSPPNN